METIPESESVGQNQEEKHTIKVTITNVEDETNTKKESLTRESILEKFQKANEKNNDSVERYANDTATISDKGIPAGAPVIVDFTPEQFDILNTYMTYYNSKAGSKHHMFKGVNCSDPTSTNFMMEEFTDIMVSYKHNKEHNPKLIKVYKESSVHLIGETEQLFCLKCKKKKYYSQSLFSLIKLVADNKPKDWVIHTLK